MFPVYCPFHWGWWILKISGFLNKKVIIDFHWPAHSDIADCHAAQGEQVGHHKDCHIVTGDKRRLSTL